MQKPHKPIIEHSSYSDVLILLSQKNYNLRELSGKLNKSHQAIHKLIIYLKYHRWIRKLKKSDTKSPLNYDKLAEEFLNYFLREYEDQEIKKQIRQEEIIKEGFLSDLLTKFIKHYAEKKELPLIETIFKEIHLTIFLWSIQTDIIDSILKNIQIEKEDLPLTIPLFKIHKQKELNVLFAKKFPQTYLFIMILLNLIDSDDYIKKLYLLEENIESKPAKKEDFKKGSE